MKQPLIIFGTSEIGRVAYEYFTHDSNYAVKAFAVDTAYKQEDTFCDLPVLTTEELLQQHPPGSVHLFVAVGSSKLNTIRRAKYEQLKQQGYQFASYISSRLFRWHDVSIGDNCLILEDNTLQTGVSIGNNTTLWSGNHIGHGSQIGDHVFITSHVCISGLCRIGDGSFLGVNATLADNVTLGRDNFIGMSAIINKSTPDDAFVAPRGTEIASISAKRFCKVAA